MHYGRKTTGVKSKEEMNSLGLILPVFLSFLLDILLNILRSFIFSLLTFTLTLLLKIDSKCLDLKGHFVLDVKIGRASN